MLDSRECLIASDSLIGVNLLTDNSVLESRECDVAEIDEVTSRS